MANLLSSPQDRFDARNKTYTTSGNVILKLRPIGPGAIDHKRKQFSDMNREPKPPVIEVNHGKGRISEMPNFKDEMYLAAMDEHNAIVGRMMIEWIFSTGIETPVPEKAEPGSVYEAVLPEDSTQLALTTRRYLYFNSVMDANDYAFLMEAIVGQQGVTQLGIAQAAADFPNNG